MVTYLGSLVSCAVGREEHCKQISLACVGSARSVLATLGLPLLMACVLSQSTLLYPQDHVLHTESWSQVSTREELNE